MKVNDSVDLGDGHFIEFGEATWDSDSISVRNRYPTKNGGFSPRSSSEIPIDDLKDIVGEALKRKLLHKQDVDYIAELCSNKKRDSFRRWRAPQSLELYGLIILFFSFTWQLIESDIHDINSSVEIFSISEKIDHIWDIERYHVYLDHENAIKSSISMDIDGIDDNWMNWQRIQDQKALANKQENVSRWIRIALYILGSMLFICAKGVEISHKYAASKQ